MDNFGMYLVVVSPGKSKSGVVKDLTLHSAVLAFLRSQELLPIAVPGRVFRHQRGARVYMLCIPVH